MATWGRVSGRGSVFEGRRGGALTKGSGGVSGESGLGGSGSSAIPPWSSGWSGYTSTPVPMFTGKTSWDQYREVFEAIVSSNGWDGVTAALQLVSHLGGDALNVALLVPASRRVMSAVLLDTLREHYSSPGRLADYRWQFERISRGRYVRFCGGIGDIEGIEGFWRFEFVGAATAGVQSIYCGVLRPSTFGWCGAGHSYPGYYRPMPCLGEPRRGYGLSGNRPHSESASSGISD